jgi:hypothetical protein
MGSSLQAPSSLSRRSLLAGGTAGLAFTLLGCGGGGISIAGVGTGGTGSFSSGPIRGFGSVLVNDVHYDEATARIVDDAGAALGGADLRLGMVADVSGSDITTTGVGQRRATAVSIHVRSEIEGPVSTIDLVNGTFSVLGQQVRVVASTVFDDDLHGGIASLVPGQIVEVYGILQIAGQYIATRIDDKGPAPTHYKLRGVVSGLDTTARTFFIGATLVSYVDITGAVPGLANGQYARLELETTSDASGAWHALRIDVAGSAIGVPATGSVEVEIEGCITALTSSARFQVNGIPVDANTVATLPWGLSIGQRVEVEGVLSAGVLIASSVEIEDDDDEFEIDGVVTRVDSGTNHFVVRNVTVDYAGARFEDGTAAQLAPGVKVEVKGRLSGDGTTLVAVLVEFGD